MSHEIRTPMNGILGTLQLIAMEPLTRDVKQLTDQALTSTTSLLTIINDILDFSKIEAGKVKLRKKQVDFPDVMNKIRDLFLQEATRNGISFSINHDPDIPKNLIIDETRLLQIFSNLISNAIKFTHNGGKIVLSAKKSENEIQVSIGMQI